MQVLFSFSFLFFFFFFFLGNWICPSNHNVGRAKDNKDNRQTNDNKDNQRTNDNKDNQQTKGVNQRSKDVTRTQQRPESPTVTLT